MRLFSVCDDGSSSDVPVVGRHCGGGTQVVCGSLSQEYKYKGVMLEWGYSCNSIIINGLKATTLLYVTVICS